MASANEIAASFCAARGIPEKTDEVAELLAGRFKRIVPYIDALSQEDFERASDDEMIDSVECIDRLAMCALVRRFPSSGRKLPTVGESGVWNLEHQLCPVSHTEMNDGRLSLLDAIHFHKTSLHSAAVDTILVGNNCLHDTDMKFLLELARGTKCRVLDARHNRLHGVGATKAAFDEALVALLELETIELVIVTHNPVASIDRKDLLSELSQASLKKLIWIPASCVDWEHWQVCIFYTLDASGCVEEKVKLVKDAHHKYYQ